MMKKERGASPQRRPAVAQSAAARKDEYIRYKTEVFKTEGKEEEGGGRARPQGQAPREAGAPRGEGAGSRAREEEDRKKADLDRALERQE